LHYFESTRSQRIHPSWRFSGRYAL
jgi:hypothetical protein